MTAASLGATTAQAAVVATFDRTATYVALPGEQNRVIFSRDSGAVLLTDLGGLLVPGPGCFGLDDHHVRCPGMVTVHALLGDGDDRAAIDGGVSGILDGGAGDDYLVGGPEGDTLEGGAGDDLLDGRGAGDLMRGGPGFDSADYSRRVERVIVTLDGASNDGELREGDNVMETERIAGGRGADVLQGDDGPNELIGGAGNDSLGGRGGEDVLDGGPGRDGINSMDPAATADTVGCGSESDRLVGDEADGAAADCERVDRSGVLGYTSQVGPGAPPPVLGRSVVVEPVSGVILITPPPEGGPANARQPVPAQPPVPLDSESNIPVGSVVDTRFGTVRMTTAIDEAGTTQAGEFFSGAYQVFQNEQAGAPADLELRGGKSFASCPRGQQGPGIASAARRRSGARPVRRLWSSAHGKFRTRGRFGAATVRGTKWLTEDRCEGTLVRVRSGAVAVQDLARGRTVIVPAGSSYLVRAP